MKKSFLPLLLCLVMAFAVGCAGNDEPAPAPEPAVQPAPEPDIGPAEESAPPAPVPAKEDIPALPSVSLDGLELEEGGGSSLSARYPAGEWTFDLSMATADFMIYDPETLETSGQVVNINAIVSADFSGTLAQEHLDAILQEFEAMGATGMEIQSAGMRSLDGEPVMYMETITAITEELLELSGITEEQIEAMGGKEALLSAPPTRQIQLYGVVEGKMLVMTGSYYDEGDKDRLLETMCIVLKTADVK